MSVLGLPVGRLPEIPVTLASGAPAATPRALRSFFGRAGTLLYLPPATCPECPAYLAKLAKAGLAWATDGIAVLVVDSTQRPAKGGLIFLRPGTPQAASTSRLGMLLALDASGRPRTIYIATQPDPALLRHHLIREP